MDSGDFHIQNVKCIFFSKQQTVAQLGFLIMNFLIPARIFYRTVINGFFVFPSSLTLSASLLHRSPFRSESWILFLHTGCFSVLVFSLFVSSLFKDSFKPKNRIIDRSAYCHRPHKRYLNQSLKFHWPFGRKYYRSDSQEPAPTS